MLPLSMPLALALFACSTAAASDWLVDPPITAVTVTTTTAGGRPAVKMSNGLITRTFITSPNWATWALEEGGEDLLRSLQPEASFQLDNANASSEVGVILVGGVLGTTNFAFKNASDPLAADPTSYTYVSHRVVPIAKRFEWTPGSRHSEETAWPPLGLGLEVTFAPPAPAQPSHLLKACPSNCSTSVCPAGVSAQAILTTTT